MRVTSSRHLLTFFLLLLPISARADDWPQWRGPNRDNKSAESGLLREWPEGGPPLVRELKGIGSGIGALVVGGGKIYLLGYIGECEYVTALDEITGQRVWSARIGAKVDEAISMRWLSQRTPTLDADRLYAFTSHGILTCLSTASGQELWRLSYIEKFGTPLHPWGLCDYPLVDGDRLICAPGGSDATMAALNKFTGEEIWRSKFDAADDWSGMNISNAAGIRQYVLYLGKQLCGVAANDGRLLWTNEDVAMPRNYTTPIVHNDLVFSSTTTGGGGGGIGLLQLSSRENGIEAKLEYFHPRNKPNAFSDSAVLHSGHVFMLSNGVTSCLNLKTGEAVWQKRIPEGSAHDGWTFAEGKLYLRQKRGAMRLIEASSQGYVEHGSFRLHDTTPSYGATMPVVAGGMLYVRDDDRLLCYDVRRAQSTDNNAVTDRVQLVAPSDPVQAQPRVIRSVFVPTPELVVTKMLELAKVKPTDMVCDLGSGDGRILAAAAKQYGCRAQGYEIDPQLVEVARASVQQAGVEDLVEVHQRDMLTANLQAADVVTLYLVPEQLAALVPQLKKLSPGSRIVSHQFPLPGIEPDEEIEIKADALDEQHTLYLWTVPFKIESPE